MFRKRVQRVIEMFDEEKLDALFIASSSNIFFLTGEVFSDLSHEAYLLVTKNDVFLFTDERYLGALTKKNFYTVVEIGRDKPISKALSDIVRHKQISRVGFEKKYLSFFEYEAISAKFDKRRSFVGCSDLIGNVRSIKEPDEIKKIEQAASLTDAAMSIAVKLLREGVSEYEIAFGIENFIKMHGASLSFPTIVAFGKHSAVPHHMTGAKKLAKEDRVVLIDMGARLDMYCADTTRVFFTQKADEELDRVFSTVLQANRAAIELFDASPSDGSLLLCDLSKTASSVVKHASLPAIPHALGHGVGIDIHELPVVHNSSTEKVKNGMVFTIEPGVYLHGKYGVRIEDLVAIVDGSMHVFSRFPKDKLVLESM